MILPALAKNSKFELAVNGAGKALLLHMGPLPHAYSWIQFDDYSDSVQLITEDGALQELGIVVADPIKKAIQSTREITMIEVGDNFIGKQQTIVVFNKVLS
jgi:hypothetical protein